MGTRAFFNDEAHQYLDNVRGLSDADRRLMEAQVRADDERLARIMADTYASTEANATEQIDSVLRICAEGDGRVDEILEDLRDGAITAKEAAQALAEARSDLNKLRKIAETAPAAEARAWDEVNRSPGEFQRAVAQRVPALFKAGRGLVSLPTYDD